MSNKKRGSYNRAINEVRCKHGHTKLQHPNCVFTPKSKPEEIKQNAKILLLDIETSPILALVWGLWEQNVNISAIVQDWHLLCWSARWIFSTETLSDCLTPEEALNHNDKRICQSIWSLLDKADIVVTHNGDNFDIKKMNTRFIKHDLHPPKAYKSVDTLKVAKEQFNFSSNKLDYINEYLGLNKKLDIDFEIWRLCFEGDSKALAELEVYNRMDVDILEDLYLKLRPYIKGHPNLNLWSTENVSICPNCGSKAILWEGYYYTNTLRYNAYRCSSCGAVGRARTNNLDKEKRATIVL